jgi:glycosyltransferase involved in cell wall biosynthesis
VDFRACEASLLRILREFKDVRFAYTGVLELGPAWKEFEGRIERLPYLPYLEMADAIAGVHVNIAPLEVGNPFVEGKSQLKIFEAGIVGIPTVASTTMSYREAVTHGEDGFLAGTEEEWYACLKALVTNPGLRNRMGEASRRRTLLQFSPSTLEKSVPVALGLEPARERTEGQSTAPLKAHSAARIEASRAGLRISWIVPVPIIGGGGHRNIFRAAYHLEKFGHRIELYFTDTDQSDAELKKIVREHFYPIEGAIHAYRGEIGETDVLFATHWSTVDPVLRNKAKTKHLMYFVQDFEPAFTAMSSAYILAENTYRRGLYHITSGPWCEKFLRERYNAKADHFRFPIDKTVYYPRERLKNNTNVVFFAKPEMPRRCYELGILALERFHVLKPDVEIVLFGSSRVVARKLPFPATLKGIVPTIQDLAQLYSDADLGMVFSTTNPSLVPYEMMACGLPIVDLRLENSECNYGDRFDTALLAHADPDNISGAIEHLLSYPAELRLRKANGLEFVKTLPTEFDMARRVESLILAAVSRAPA